MHDNLHNLGVQSLELVNLRLMFDPHGPAEGPIEAPLRALEQMRHEGLVRHIGLSNATPAQVRLARSMTDLACVQNHYNVAHRGDDALIDELATAGIAYVPYFPLGGFTPLQSTTLSDVARDAGATTMQVALAWLLQRAPNILLIPGTASNRHLRENLAAVELQLDAGMLRRLDAMAHVAPMRHAG